MATRLNLLHHGRSRFYGAPSDLPHAGEVIELEVGDTATAVNVLRALGAEVTEADGSVSCSGVALQEMLSTLSEVGLVPTGVEMTRSSLEDLLFGLASENATAD